MDVEHVSGGRLVTDDVLDHAVFADEVAGTPITFGHVTPSALKQLGVTMGSLFGDGWLDYRPTLDLGADVEVADESVAIPLGTGTDIFSAGGSPSPGAGPVDGEATAEWLEVRVTPPGAEPEVARRTVFDRLPADLRAAGRAGPGCDRAHRARRPRGRRRTCVPADARGPHLRHHHRGDQHHAISSPMPVTGTPCSRSPSAACAIRWSSRLALDAGARTFVDGPNIVSVSLEVLEVGQVPTVRIGLDIWHRDHGVLPLTASSTTAAEARLLKGVADHITERYVVEGLAHEAGSDAQPTGVGRRVRGRSGPGGPIRVLRDAIPDPLPFGPRATALIEDALDDGDVVIVPAEPVTIGGTEHIGWWRVDPVTGAATDVMDGGAGTSMVEYGKIISDRLRSAWVICKGPAARAAMLAIVATYALRGGPTEDLAKYLAPGGVAGTREDGSRRLHRPPPDWATVRATLRWTIGGPVAATMVRCVHAPDYSSRRPVDSLPLGPGVPRWSRPSGIGRSERATGGTLPADAPPRRDERAARGEDARRHPPRDPLRRRPPAPVRRRVYPARAIPAWTSRLWMAVA